MRFARQGQEAPKFIFKETKPGKIHFASVGEGIDTIVFVHGSPGSWSAFSRFLMDEDLKKAGRLISVDRPRFGLSEPKTPEPSLREQSRRIAEALQKDGVVNNAILVGHSLGGPVIVRMAADYPDLVKGLVLVAPSMDPEIQRRQWYNYAAKFPPVKWGLSKDWVHSNEEIYPLEIELKWLADRSLASKPPPSLSKEWMTSSFRRVTRTMSKKLSRAPGAWTSAVSMASTTSSPGDVRI